MSDGDKKEIKLSAGGKKILEASQNLISELRDLTNIYKKGVELFGDTKPRVAERYEIAKFYVEDMRTHLETAQKMLINKGDPRPFMKMISTCRDSLQNSLVSLPNTPSFLSLFSTPGKHLILESLTKAEDKINTAVQSLRKESLAIHDTAEESHKLN